MAGKSNNNTLKALQELQEADGIEAKLQKEALAVMEAEDDSDVQFIGGQQDPWFGAEVDHDQFHYCRVSENPKRTGTHRANYVRMLQAGYKVAPHPEMESGKADWPEMGLAIMRLPIKIWNARQKTLERERVKNAGWAKNVTTTRSMDPDFGEVQKSQGGKMQSMEDLGIDIPEE